MTSRTRLLAIIGPGMLVDATGVGAGDLATAGFAGSKLGLAIIWAVPLGAFLKFVLNEGLARWQLATGQTLLEGAMAHFGWPLKILFLLYFLPWSFFTGAALISACGVTMHAMIPLFEDDAQARLVFGIAHSLVGVIIAWGGGFKWFGRIMGVCIGIMFVAVITTAIMLRPDLSQLMSGLLRPTIPQFSAGGLTWTIALFGGVGGTLTVLCYGYWIREAGRTGPDDLRICRIDLVVGYIMIALFGMGMIIIANGIELQGKGAGLIVSLADRIQETAGNTGRWIFLIGAWTAVFSSLLGVWQAVPYLFADYCSMLRTKSGPESAPGVKVIDTRAMPYRIFLLALAIIPLLQVTKPFEDVQKYYAILGAAFIPFLAALLLVMNSRTKWVGARHRNRWLTVVILVVVLLLSCLAGVVEIRKKWAPDKPVADHAAHTISN